MLLIRTKHTFERRKEMTIHEASERYNIPLDVLHEYERWGLCGAVKKEWGPGSMMILTGTLKYDHDFT